MTIIKENRTVHRYRVECPECTSIIEGKPEEFTNKTSITDSWYEFECPVCKTTREISCYRNKNWCKVIRYRINEDGTIGDEV